MEVPVTLKPPGPAIFREVFKLNIQLMNWHSVGTVNKGNIFATAS